MKKKNKLVEEISEKMFGRKPSKRSMPGSLPYALSRTSTLEDLKPKKKRKG